MHNSNVRIEDQLGNFFDLSLDMLCFANTDGFFLHVNRAFTHTLGYTRDELLATPIIDFVHPDDREATRKALQEIDNGLAELTAFENRYRCADGSYKWLSWNSTISPDDPDLIYAIARDITPQKQQAQNLAESHNRIRTILESITDAFFALDKNWRFTYVNQEAEHLIFRERDDLIGKSVWEEFPEAVNSTFYNQYHHCVETQTPATFIEYYPPLETWFEVHAYPAEDHAISIYFRDVSEQKRLESQLQEAVNTLEQRVAERTIALSEANKRLEQQITEREEAQEAESRLVAILEATSDLVGVADMNGKITYLNRAGRQMIGVDPDHDLTDRFVREITADWAFQLILDEALPTAIKKGIWLGETALKSLDGREIPLSQVVITHMDDDGNLEFVSTVARDITERKRIEQNLRDALQVEKELNALKTRFVTMISHEFRTPLAAIQSATDMMERYAERMSPEKLRSYYDQIRSQIKHLTFLMEGVLTITKGEYSGIEFEPRPIDIEAFCRDIISEVELVSGAKDRIEFDTHGTPRSINADGMLLRQILNNLLANALKYSPSSAAVRFDLTYATGAVVFEITDRGIGIPEQDQKRLFDVFHRAENVGTIQGTGIGLAIVHQALLAHQGDIQIESEENRGTTITVTLPSAE